MIEDSTITAEEVKTVAQKVLAIERVVLRRAWGLAYAVATAELLLRFLLPVSAYELGLSAVFSVVGNLVFSAAIALAGFAVTIWILRRIYALRFVRKSILGSFWSWALRPLPALVIFVLAYAALFAVITFFGPNGATVLFLFLAAGTPGFYYPLKISFPERLPSEGLACLFAYGVATIATVIITISPLAVNFVPYLAIWGALTLVFFLAFLYTRSLKLPAPPKETT
jgi:hypothetical protein